MLSTTVSGVDLNHVGTCREYGMAEALIPFPLLCNLPMLAVVGVDCRSELDCDALDKQKSNTI